MKSLGINWLAKQNQTMAIVLRFENQILILKFSDKAVATTAIKTANKST